MGAFVSKHGRDGKAVEQNRMNSMNHPQELAGDVLRGSQLCGHRRGLGHHPGDFDR